MKHVREWIRRNRAELAVGGLAFAVSFLSLFNGFAYDDAPIVYGNDRIHALRNIPALFADSYWGANVPAGGYRPLTLAAFALQWKLSGGGAFVFHIVNVLLYAALSVLVYRLARRVLAPTAAFIAAALFAIHPVHVEAVANIVGQAELFVALGCVGGVLLYVRERARGTMRWSVIAGIVGCYVVAVLAKENGIVLPALLVAAELWVVNDPRDWRARGRAVRPVLLVLTALALVYIQVRSMVLGDVAGMPPHTAYIGIRLTPEHRVLTMIGFAKEWARLLFWPARLVAEYSPPMTPLAIELSTQQLPGFVVLLAAAMVFWLALKRGWNDVAFSLAWIAISMAPVSGFFVATGFILAERTLMLPSVGAMLLAGAAGARLWAALPASVPRQRARTLGLAGLAIVGALGFWRSAMRQQVWRDNSVLFPQTLLDAPDSYRAHQIFGMWLFAVGYPGEGEKHLWHAIKLYPYDPVPPFLLAEEYRKRGACDRALPLYKWSLQTPQVSEGFALGPYARCLLATGQYDEARRQTLRGIARGELVKDYRKLLRRVDSARVRSREASANE
ncbi:MAG TPA: glycosyltransferase family 39 protein [Gemmatimonadaceae bacterium]|nr:glycosyltransferase family 39 protein [Gemmatimonadaceae bacterium]